MNPDDANKPPENTYSHNEPTSPLGLTGTNSTPRNKFRKGPLFWAVLAILIIGAATIATYLVAHSTESSNLFDAALSNALQTNNFTQTTTVDSSYATIQYDVSNPGNATVQSVGKLVQGDTAVSFNGYGTFKDSFIKFTTFTNAGKPVPPAALNKWFQVRTNGFDASSGYFATLSQNDPNLDFFGDIIFGNFSMADRDKLLDYIRQHNVYSFDKSTAQHQTYKGQPVIVYSVTENQTALADYNKFVGNMVGLSDTQLKQDLANTQYAGSAKVFISESTNQFVHVQTSDSSLVDYYDYGTTKLGSAPTPQTTFEQFEAIVGAPLL